MRCCLKENASADSRKVKKASSIEKKMMSRENLGLKNELVAVQEKLQFTENQLKHKELEESK